MKLTNISCHFFGADLSKVSGHDAVVERVEHTHQPGVHPGGRFGIEDEVEAEERGHHREVAKYSQAVAHFVGQQEPLVHQPRGSPLEQI